MRTQTFLTFNSIAVLVFLAACGRAPDPIGTPPESVDQDPSRDQSLEAPNGQWYGVATRCLIGVSEEVERNPNSGRDYVVLSQRVGCSPVFEAPSKDKVQSLIKEWRATNCPKTLAVTGGTRGNFAGCRIEAGSYGDFVTNQRDSATAVLSETPDCRAAKGHNYGHLQCGG